MVFTSFDVNFASSPTRMLLGLQKQKYEHTTASIPKWSPTSVLIDRFQAYHSRADGMLSFLESMVVCKGKVSNIRYILTFLTRISVPDRLGVLFPLRNLDPGQCCRQSLQTGNRIFLLTFLFGSSRLIIRRYVREKWYYMLASESK